MKIEFYEEFPNEKNLAKLKLIRFPTKIFIAAKSVSEFKKFEKIAKKYKKNLEVAYWPIIKNSYYVSPFSKPDDLKDLFKKLNSIKNPLLIDIELPIPKIRILSNFLKISENKKLIKEFIKTNKKRITIPQQPFAILSGIFKWFGLIYEGFYEKNPMYYSSMCNKKINRIIRKAFMGYKNKKEYAIGLGTIATGVLGNEPLLSPENLKRDLKFVKNAGFRKVIIFRLGGLNKDYIGVIESFS